MFLADLGRSDLVAEWRCETVVAGGQASCSGGDGAWPRRM